MTRIWGESLEYLMNFFGVIVILGVVWFLYQKGVIQNLRFPVIKYKFTFNHSSTKGKLNVRYGKYNGVTNYLFKVKPGEPMEFHYDVSVEEGSLAVTFGKGKEKVFTKEWFESEKGTISFTPKTQTYFVVITGKHTKGSCSIQLTEVKETEKIES